MPNAVLFTSARRIEALVDAYPEVSFEEYGELSRYIVRGTPLHGDVEQIRRWSERCREIPREMRRTQIRKDLASVRFHFPEGNLQPLVDRHDWIMVNRTLCESVVSVLRIVYLLNDEVMIKPKRSRVALDELRDKPSDLCSRLEALLVHDNSETAFREKIQDMNLIFAEVKDLVDADSSTVLDS